MDGRGHRDAAGVPAGCGPGRSQCLADAPGTVKPERSLAALCRELKAVVDEPLPSLGDEIKRTLEFLREN